ncbi:carboxypeptidase-like regulatory domain-containing protein [Pontibacter sp. BT213]|uniref:Carboxypeptidase-like regulatory domain-containing protein n=2 Tax=Pontibacter fetidus TaxID=2700082 RepID=A0A6B2H684_9BACT|nr:carboxypeptidase-like regulatory domain-containing protein [Pontibacter fetidus]
MMFAFAAKPHQAKAQGGQRVVQLSGFVTIGDSLYGVSSVSVFVPKTGRGVQTNRYGFFSLPVLTGDTVVFSALGYKKQTLVIPRNYPSSSYSIIMQMQEEAIELAEVKVIPWATERDFKEAVLALKLPDEGRTAANKNVDPERLRELFSVVPMDGNANSKVYNQHQQIQSQNRYLIPTISPFAVLKLLDMLKNGEFKKK